MRGAWYAQGGGKARELYTILHLPYTSMVLSYVLIGAALSPIIDPDRVILTLFAYFLGLGLSAHALNELHVRHWGDALGKRELQFLFGAPLLGALLVGAYGMYVLNRAAQNVPYAPLILFAFMITETFFLFAYNLEISVGKFHSDLSFAFSWAALPVIISYYVNALSVSAAVILVALGSAATAEIEINLSRWCKDWRRRSSLSEMRFEDGSTLSMTTAQLIAKPEKCLKLIVAAVDLVAVAFVVYRLLM